MLFRVCSWLGIDQPATCDGVSAIWIVVCQRDTKSNECFHALPIDTLLMRPVPATSAFDWSAAPTLQKTKKKKRTRKAKQSATFGLWMTIIRNQLNCIAMSRRIKCNQMPSVRSFEVNNTAKAQKQRWTSEWRTSWSKQRKNEKKTKNKKGKISMKQNQKLNGKLAFFGGIFWLFDLWIHLQRCIDIFSRVTLRRIKCPSFTIFAVSCTFQHDSE